MILLGVEVDVAGQVGVQDIPAWLSIANAIFVTIFVCLGDDDMLNSTKQTVVVVVVVVVLGLVKFHQVHPTNPERKKPPRRYEAQNERICDS